MKKVFLFVMVLISLGFCASDTLKVWLKPYDGRGRNIYGFGANAIGSDYDSAIITGKVNTTKTVSLIAYENDASSPFVYPGIGLFGKYGAINTPDTITITIKASDENHRPENSFTIVPWKSYVTSDAHLSIATMYAIEDTPQAYMHLPGDVGIKDSLRWIFYEWGDSSYITLEASSDTLSSSNVFDTNYPTYSANPYGYPEHATGMTSILAKFSSVPTDPIYWRIRYVTYDSPWGQFQDTAWSAWSSWVSFNKSTFIPVPLSPGNNSLLTNVQDTLTWQSVSGAVNYQVQVSTESAFHTIALSSTGVNTSFGATLGRNCTYYWRVRDSLSGLGTVWSPAWSFTIVPFPPSTPVLSSPINGATNLSTTLTLNWLGATGATSYGVQISTSISFVTTVTSLSNISSTSAQISSLGNGSTYYWEVISSNSGGISAWSNAWSFTTIPMTPDKPTLVSPINNSTNQPVTLTLSWNTLQGATSYSVQVSTNNTFSSPVTLWSGLTGTSQIVSQLTNGVTYYWEVNGTNYDGTGAWSSVWSFTTIPKAPTLVSPTNGSIDQPVTVTLNWNTFPGARSYSIQISGTSTFSTLIAVYINVTETSQIVSQLTNGFTYYWEVNDTNPGGVSTWSSAWSFTTKPKTPTLISPINGSIDQPSTVTLNWNTVQGISSYSLQVSTNSIFSPLVVDWSGTGAGTSQAVFNLTNGVTYYWEVNGTNSGGTSVWSSVWSFTTKSVVATLPMKNLNDFNPKLFENGGVLEYTLLKSAMVEIILFDLSGRIIFREERFEHVGMHKLSRVLPYGRYVAQLNTLGIKVTRLIIR